MDDALFYSIGDVERLSAETIKEAVNNYAQEYQGSDDELKREKIMIQAYKRVVVDDQVFQDALDSISERIDEAHGDPDGDPPVFSGKSMAHFEAFKQQFLSEYTSCQFESSGESFEVTVGDILWLG